MEIQNRIATLRQQLPPNVRLVCVSKFHPETAITEAYNVGERDFGESRAQELARKVAVLPHDIRWHFIGSLQTNKVKMVVPIAYLIHSVDSEKLLAAINDCAAKNGSICNVLLEVHIATDSTKHGFAPNEIANFFASSKWEKYANVHICGLMGMGTLDANESQTRQEFNTLHTLFLKLKNIFAQTYFNELSMGMTHDFPLAIEEGSTCVRIGTFIFGERQY